MLDDRDYMRPHWPHGGYGHGLGENSAVKKLIIINVVIFLLQLVPGGDIKRSLALTSQDAIQFWRFGTYMFLHGDMWHLLFNMWALFIFGSQLEKRLGMIRLVKVYMVSGLLGGITWLLFNISSTSYVIGASGAVFGLMGAAALLCPNEEIMMLFPPVRLRMKTLVVFTAIIEVMMLYNMHSGVAHLAHLGGLLGGLLYVKKEASAANHRRRHVQRGASSKDFGSIVGEMRERLFNSRNADRGHRRPPNLRIVTDDNTSSDEEFISVQIDPILDKIGKFGMKSLTPQERRILERAREKLKDRT